MYLKFGFGRSNQDACIEIRRGAMSRMQGINLVNLYDGNHPTEDQINEYLKYYEITREEYEKCIDKWTNKKLFKKNNKTGKWEPTFKIK